MSIRREDILLALQSALVGEIYPEIRAIVFKYTPKEKSFILRYYLDRVPKDEDYESIKLVISEFVSHFSYVEFEELKDECIYSTSLLNQVEVLDGFVYSRKEY